MASTDARPQPLKNTAYRVTFTILDADGDPVSGAAGLDSEVSKDGGTFADCTNEATEIATSSGVYYLDLTATEMNADTVAVIVKTSTSGAKTTVIVLYPAESTDIPVNVTGWNGTAVATPDTAGYPKVTLKSGTGTGEVNLSSGRADGNVTYIGGSAVNTSAAQLGVNVVNAGGTAWASVVAALIDAVWDELLSGHTTSGSAGKGLSDAAGAASPATIADAVWDEMMSGHGTVGSMAEALAIAMNGQMVNGDVTAAINLQKAFSGQTYNASGLTVGAATAVTNAVNANLTNINSTAALLTALVALLRGAVPGTVVSGTNTTTVVSTGLTSAETGFYIGKVLMVQTGALAGQGGKLVTAYDGATKRLTVEAMTSALSVGDTFVLVG